MNDTTLDLQDDKEITPPKDQVKFIEDEARPLWGNQTTEEKDRETPTDPQ